MLCADGETAVLQIKLVFPAVSQPAQPLALQGWILRDLMKRPVDTRLAMAVTTARYNTSAHCETEIPMQIVNNIHIEDANIYLIASTSCAFVVAVSVIQQLTKQISNYSLNGQA